jgi:hypothetical protein
MKYILFAIVLISFNCGINRVFYGYPDSDYSIKDGCLVIVNIPIHQDGKFINSQSLDSLVLFVNNDTSFNYRIEINICDLHNSYFNKAYSESLYSRLTPIMEERAVSDNYEIVARGDDNPIFMDKESDYYKLANTRIDIFIEEKGKVQHGIN